MHGKTNCGFRKRCRQLIMLFACCLMAAAGAHAAPVPELGLDAEQRRWLEAHPSIRLGVDIDWAPFEYIDENKAYVGMAAEYIALVERKLGIEFDVEREKPWSEVVEMVKAGELDMFSCVVATSQRREFVDFTRPYLSFPMVIVTSDKVNYVGEIADMRGEKVAVVEGYATQDLMEKNHPEIDLYLAQNVADALDKVSHGQVYAYIGNIATVSYVIKREGLTNIKVSGETPYQFELSMAVRKDWAEFVPILQKAIDSISEEEQNQIYQNWISLRYEYGFDYTLLWKVLVVVALVLAVILYWNRSMSREISRRIEVEQRLNETHQQLECTNRQLLDYVEIVDRYVITSTTDHNGIITSTSEAFCQISGYSRQELIGSSHSIVRHEDMPASLYHDLWSTISAGKTWQGEIKNRKKDGSYYWVQAYISPVFGPGGEITGFTAIREDITDRKRAEELSITDELTSLFNRRYFNTLFPQEIARISREDRHLGLLLIDVDHFKQYNDHYGHQKGDATLQAVARALKDNLHRAGDFVFRVGGEEFAAILSTDAREKICLVAEKLRQAVEDLRIEHGYSSVAPHVTVSIGVNTHHNSDGYPADVDRMYRQADDALYRAKQEGRNRYAEHQVPIGLPQAKSS